MSDEDALTIPQEWLRHIHPRRGGLPGPVLELHGRDDALPLQDDAAAHLREVRGREVDPVLAEAARRHLDGEPDPAGAAALAATAARAHGWKAQAEQTRIYRPFVDLWIADHGLVFAALALLELCRTTYRHIPGIEEAGPARPYSSGRLWQSVGPNMGNLLRVRTLLAASDDDVYAEADRRLPAVRWEADRQWMADWLVVYLLPTRQDDVDRCLASVDLHPGFPRLVHCSLGRPGQVAALPPADHLSVDEMATLLEGVGTDVLRPLVQCLNNHPLPEARDLYLAAITMIPTDDALRALLERRARPEVQGPLKAAMARFPVRTARLLADKYADAAAMLLREHARTHRDVLTAALPGLPNAARTVLAPLIDPPPPLPDTPADQVPAFLSDAPRGRKSRPEWLDASTLPQVRLRDAAGALPLDSVRRLLEVLALPTPHRVADMREAFDPDSLARFGRAVFELWRDAGEPKKDDWALVQLGRTGDDATVRVLAPLLRTWPAQGGRGKAAKALGVLTALGTDPALTLLTGIAEKGKQATLRKAARLEIDELARHRGLTSDELADRLVPRFGLAADGSLTLDYGPRRFVVGFDEELKPYVLDEKGKRRASLPKPGAKDDPELAAAARATFAALKKDVRAVASTQLHRYETAMLTGRRWTARNFRDHVAGHPFASHLARRLLWIAEPAPANGTGATLFRVAEDRTFADVDDEAFELPESSRVGVVHPLHLDGALPAWGRVFADYEIVQPFAQLDRPVLDFTDTERDGAELRRFEGLTVPIQAVMRLEPRGWVRGEVLHGASATSISKRVGEDRYVVIGLTPGISVDNVYRYSGDQELHYVRLATEPRDYPRPKDGVRFGDLDPLTASELLNDLTALADEAATA